MKNIILVIPALVIEYLLIIKLNIKGLMKRKPPKNWLQGDKKDIILLHGYRENWIFLEKIGNFLSNKGYKIHVPKRLGISTASIVTNANTLESYIRENNLKNIILVSHSKGGLIAKHFLDHSKYSKNIEKVISIATPYRGTYFSFLIGNIELSPISKIIKAINRDKSSCKKIINIYPSFDNHVIPNRNLLLESAKNIKVEVVGHTKILENPQTLETIYHFI
jgi:esterase/lipase